ncbi:MAG: ArsR family transcriptional regulator [Nitrososphaerota archaeon]
MSSEDKKVHIETKLRGKTLLVYWYLLKHGNSPVGVRHIQRELGFSSPSIVSHHLEKLIDLGLVKRNERGEYIPIEEVKIGIFKEFIRIGRLIFPRYIFYAVLFTTMLLSYIIIYQQNFSPHNTMALIFGFLACIILWYETLRLLKETPI